MLVFFLIPAKKNNNDVCWKTVRDFQTCLQLHVINAIIKGHFTFITSFYLDLKHLIQCENTSRPACRFEVPLPSHACCIIFSFHIFRLSHEAPVMRILEQFILIPVSLCTSTGRVAKPLWWSLLDASLRSAPPEIVYYQRPRSQFTSYHVDQISPNRKSNSHSMQ